MQLKDVKVGDLLSELTVLMREHSLVMPSDLTILFKAMITLEGLGRQLDPQFEMVPHLTPFVKHVLRERYSPAAVLKRGQHSVKDMLSIVTELPRDLARLLKEARRGRVKIDLDLKRLDRFGQVLDRSVSRLTLGIMTASLVIGSSIVMTVSGGIKIFGLVGFLLAFINSIWLIFSIWRSGKD
jgi:ubiquinone biosynthesis protein